MRIILHIDVNSAYLSWTARELLRNGKRTDIRKGCSAIAGDPSARRGVILAKSEAAKSCGVVTGESILEARRKCPGLELYPPDHDLYERCSDELNAVLSRWSPRIERFSVDESWLDYTESRALFGDPLDAAHAIRKAIREELGFTVNVGVSTNKLLAKMASDLRKPDMVHTLFPDEIAEKMWPLPVRELFSVGRVTAKKLEGVGIRTIGDIAAAQQDFLRALLGNVQGQTVHEYANGISDAPVIPNEQAERKGIGNSVTLPSDVTNVRQAEKVLLSLCEKTCSRLRAAGCYTDLVSVTIRPADFARRQYGHQRRLPAPLCATSEVYAVVKELFREAWKGEPVRLLGVAFGEIQRDRGGQLDMFAAEGDAPDETLDRTVDEIRARFGKDAVKRGTLANRPPSSK
ncbi:MAG: DNA polymerase IV [Clostridiales Family XIII bacterium]|jgi:DNA polymerase-4|nr:DNA polymerase IV [Clostridiales Family XIII bacterium]